MVRIDTDDLIDSHEVARLVGLSNVNGVSVYRRRYSDFPEPVIERGRCVLWVRAAVEQWSRARR